MLVLLVGGATYPTAGLRSAVMSMVVTGIVGAAVQQLTRTLRGQAATLREREAELETAAAERSTRSRRSSASRARTR